MARYFIWVLALGVLLNGCAGDASAPPAAGSESGDVEWGIGMKADGVCKLASDLCWPSEASAQMRKAMRSQDALLSGLGSARDEAEELVAALETLSPKLKSSERSALSELAVEASSLSADASDSQREDFVRHAQEGVLERLVATYVAAYMVPIGAEAQASMKGDGPGTGSEPLPSVLSDPDVRASLDMLKDSGVFGKLYAFLFEHTGVLDEGYPLFDEAFPFSEPREDRLERIIDHHQWIAARDAAITGVESLIPVAGIVISFSHRQLLDFRNKMRMALEVASLYGIDVREGQNLFLIVTTVMELPNLRETTAASFAVRFLIKFAVEKGAGISVKQITQALLAKAAGELLKHVTAKGAEMAAKAAASNAAISAGKQVLGLATFGLVILIDAGVSAHIIDRMGRRVSAHFRPWGVGMLEESGHERDRREDREHIARVLGELMQADGSVKAVEKKLLAVHFAKIWYRDGTWYGSQASEWTDFALMAKEGGDVKHAGDQLDDLSDEDRLAVLEVALLMITVDGEISPAEEQVYQDFQDKIWKDGWFGGLEEDHVLFMRDMIESLLVRPTEIVPAGEKELVEGVTATDVLPFMAEAYPGQEAEIACAFDGAC
jgi:hypothetical protein